MDGWSRITRPRPGRTGRSPAVRAVVVATIALLVPAGCATGGDGILRQAGITAAPAGTGTIPATSGDAAPPAEVPTDKPEPSASASPAASPNASTGPAASAGPTTSAETSTRPTIGPTTSTPPAGPVAATVTGRSSPADVRYGDNGTFALTVFASSAPVGTDLSGPVVVRDGSTVVAEGTTDAVGAAALAFYNTVDPGDHTYSVTFGGNGAVQSATGSFVVRTTTTNVDIAIDGPTGVQPGQPATIGARVIGTPRSPTGPVTLSVDGVVTGQGPVDDRGRFAATLPAAAAGEHEITVSYAGDIRFNPATASSSFSVAPPAAIANPAAAAAASPCPATADACVDLTNEQAWLQSGGTITYGPVPITSGAAGSRTRTGTFAVFWKDKDHRSSLFDDAPMPNSVFFDRDIAFHQGSLSRQSNGCIHLSWDASAAFFDALSNGSQVTVFGAPPY